MNLLTTYIKDCDDKAQQAESVIESLELNSRRMEFYLGKSLKDLDTLMEKNGMP